MLINFGTRWQTKTEQSLNGFASSCFVVDAKCGGGKKTLCVLHDLLCTHERQHGQAACTLLVSVFLCVYKQLKHTHDGGGYVLVCERLGRICVCMGIYVLQAHVTLCACACVSLCLAVLV